MQENSFSNILVELDDFEIHQLRLNTVYTAVLDTICDKLGFSFATLSTRDDDQQEIRTVASRNIPAGWQSDAHHPVDSHDIQADVLRSGKIEVISGWDARFDKQIWKKYHHAELVRVWVPLGQLGTIEAGFTRAECKRIPPPLIDGLTRYARSVTVAIRNAQLYETELRHTATLALLQKSANELRTGSVRRGRLELLEHFANTALSVLRASIILLYPLQKYDYLLTPHGFNFAAPVCAGDIDGHRELKAPEDQANIVHYIAETRAPYYRSDARQDPLLTSPDSVTASASDKHKDRPKSRSFTERQEIRSFAGVPLLAREALLGVLCINYRTRHQFEAHECQVIELFANQAAAVIANDEFIRNQERNRLKADLHDTVKSELRGLILLNNSAAAALDTNVDMARMCMHEIGRGAWTILSDVNLFLDDLSADTESQDIVCLIQAEIDRLTGNSQITTEVSLGEAPPALQFRLARVVMNVVREAVVNAIKHSRAQTLRVHASHDEDWLCLTIADDGVGFRADAPVKREHRGLVIMQERACEIGGELTITSALGEGTTIAAKLPLKEDK